LEGTVSGCGAPGELPQPGRSHCTDELPT